MPNRNRIAALLATALLAGDAIALSLGSAVARPPIPAGTPRYLSIALDIATDTPTPTATATETQQPTSVNTPTETQPVPNCDPSYPTVCIPPPPQ